MFSYFSFYRLNISNILVIKCDISKSSQCAVRCYYRLHKHKQCVYTMWFDDNVLHIIGITRRCFLQSYWLQIVYTLTVCLFLALFLFLFCCFVLFVCLFVLTEYFNNCLIFVIQWVNIEHASESWPWSRTSDHVLSLSQSCPPWLLIRLLPRSGWLNAYSLAPWKLVGYVR